MIEWWKVYPDWARVILHCECIVYILGGGPFIDQLLHGENI